MSVKRKQPEQQDTMRKILARYFPVWALLLVIFLPALPDLLGATINLTVRTVKAAPATIIDVGGDVLELGAGAVVSLAQTAGDAVKELFTSRSGSDAIAPLFTAEVTHWAGDIERWSTEYNLDPNLLATVMQIESCGHPTVNSHAGAQGLFQVMPFHFATGEDMLDPDTNAMRGAAFLNYCLDAADGDAGMAMACYNGGPSVLSKPFDQWLNEPQRYYYWGTGIYADAQQDASSSGRLDEWLQAGGATLCSWAADEIGLN